MEFYGKPSNAAGKDPDFGAIFMSSGATKRECFQRGLFGLPSSYSQFVKQIKAGIILFLFEYEKRVLHGVYKSCSDGGMNIVPDAFSSSRKQFPAQVKFIPVWRCELLNESEFCGAIKENYFSAKKFYFGLSEKQVCQLLSLFSERKLDLKLPGRQLARMKDVKPECYPVGRVGRTVDGRMHMEIVENQQDAVTNTLPFKMCNYRGDSSLYSGEVDDIGLNRSGILGNKRRGDDEIGMDSASGYVSDYLALKDHRTSTGHNKEHCIDMQLRSTIKSGLSGNLSGEARVHEDNSLRVSDRITSEHITKSGQRIVFSKDRPGLHSSDFNQTVFSNKPMLDPDSVVQNQLRTTAAMLQPIKAQISDNLCAAQGDLNSRSIHLYDSDTHGFDISRPSSVRIRVNDSSKPILESASRSNIYRRNSIYSFNDRPSHMHTEQKDTNQFQVDSYGFMNHVPCESNRTSKPFYVAQNSERLAATIVEHEGRDCFPLNYSSVPSSPLDIGNRSWESEPYSSLYHKFNSCVCNDAHSIALQENLGHEVTLPMNKETYSPVVPWENEGYSQVQYGDPLIHEHDLDYECCQNSGSSNSVYKNKNSVFSRLSFVQDLNNSEYGSNNLHREHDVCTSNSVDEVMEMVRQSHKQQMMKRKLKPLVKHSKAESLRDKKQHISSSRLTRASFEKSLDDTNMDMTTASEGKTNKIAEDIRFVDFKRRSHVRKIDEETKIRDSNETSESEDLGIVQQKKRKLIRPNFAKSRTSDNMDINIGASQKLKVALSQESSEPKDDSKSCSALAQSEEDIKKDVKNPDLVRQTQLEDKSNNARGCIDCQGGGKPTDGQFICNIRFKDGPECPENLNNQIASSSASCEAKSLHNKEGLCMKDDLKPISSDAEVQHSICEAHEEDKVICGSTSINIEGVIKDDRLPLTIEVKDRSESSQNLANENALTATCKKINNNVEKASNMHSEKAKALLSISDSVDRRCCYFGETAMGSKMPDSSSSGLNSVGINTSVTKN